MPIVAHRLRRQHPPRPPCCQEPLPLAILKAGLQRDVRTMSRLVPCSRRRRRCGRGRVLLTCARGLWLCDLRDRGLLACLWLQALIPLLPSLEFQCRPRLHHQKPGPYRQGGRHGSFASPRRSSLRCWAGREASLRRGCGGRASCTTRLAGRRAPCASCSLSGKAHRV